MKAASFVIAALCMGSGIAAAADSDAVAISANITAKHMPFGTILDPIYSSASSNQIVGYTRCGDSALWTGADLAAEAFRYKVTQSADAWNNLNAALAGLKSLVDVTGDDRVARCIVHANSPYAAGIASEEANNTIHQNPPWIWVDNTSRDEVVGVFFGLGAAYDLVEDPGVRSAISSLATRMIAFIANHNWTPNDDLSNTFLLRPEELQMLLQVARHVNPANTVSGPAFVPPVDTGVLVDVLSNSSYFKFNLDFMSFYNLVRLQNNSDNLHAYQIVRTRTAYHQNAFFDVIDRALQGADPARDQETVTLLNQWLLRPRRDTYVDVSGSVSVCGSEACQPVPVPLRPPADFLWQTDPFSLSGGGSGLIESAGIDYILPYWMARYYGVIAGSAVQPAAAPGSGVAPGSIASLYGTNLATGTASATTQPLPQILTGTSMTITDAAGNKQMAPLLYVSPTQINFVIPDGAASGTATFQVLSSLAPQTFTARIEPTSPTLFTMNGTGTGVAAATALAIAASNPQTVSPVSVFQCAGSVCNAMPLVLSSGASVYVSFYGTGIRNRSALANVTAVLNGIPLPVLYAGPAPGFTGLDQVNVALTPNLAGSGLSHVYVTVDGQTSNVVTIDIQ